LSYGAQELLFVGLHLADERLIFGFFVPGCPENHFGEDRRKIDTFGGEHVNQFSPIGWVLFRGDDAMSYQFLQAIGQYVRGDSFVGLHEFLVRSESTQHHVSEDQQ
jgi:hypothetical protein